MRNLESYLPASSRSSAFSRAWEVYKALESHEQNILFSDALRIGWFLVWLFVKIAKGQTAYDTGAVYSIRKSGSLKTWIRFDFRVAKDALFVTVSGDPCQEWEGSLRLMFDRWTGEFIFAKFRAQIASDGLFNCYRSEEGDRLRKVEAEEEARRPKSDPDLSDWTSAKYVSSNGRGAFYTPRSMLV